MESPMESLESPMESLESQKSLETFQTLMATVMTCRPPRHFLWTTPRNPQSFVMEILLQDNNYVEIAAWAINGSPYCQSLLAHWANSSTEIKHEVLADLNQRMDELDSHGPCRRCDSTDLCSCFHGHCPACDDTLCEQYACKRK